jgi:CheY-like chemotaxis protein
MSGARASDAADRGSAVAGGAHAAVSILLAEDDAGHATLIQRTLREAGFVNPILHFRDGRDVLDYLGAPGTADEIRRGRSFLLLLDIRMPRVDGVEVLRELQCVPLLKTIPAIMLTTTDDPREIRRCYELGCRSCITKPVRIPLLLETLGRVGLFLQVVGGVPPAGGADRP